MVILPPECMNRSPLQPELSFSALFPFHAFTSLPELILSFLLTQENCDPHLILSYTLQSFSPSAKLFLPLLKMNPYKSHQWVLRCLDSFFSLPWLSITFDPGAKAFLSPFPLTSQDIGFTFIPLLLSLYTLGSSIVFSPLITFPPRQAQAHSPNHIRP